MRLGLVEFCFKVHREFETEHAVEPLQLGVRRSKRGDAALNFAVALEENHVLGHGLFDQLFDHEYFRGVDDGVDAVLKGLHRREGLEGIAQ